MWIRILGFAILNYYQFLRGKFITDPDPNLKFLWPLKKTYVVKKLVGQKNLF
jgi:hypothetical protein